MNRGTCSPSSTIQAVTTHFSRQAHGLHVTLVVVGGRAAVKEDYMQRVLLPFVTLVLVAPGAVSAQLPRRDEPSPTLAARDSIAEREVRATDAARFVAVINSDFAALDTLLGPELTYVHNDGTRESKSVFIGALRSGETKYLAMQPDSEQVRVYGNTAVGDGRIYLRARVDTRVGSFTGRFLEVYVRRHGHWELVAWQSTRLTDVTWEK